MLEAFTVLRSIPHEVMIGLLTGQYSIHGGVIRWAMGTEHAGQIVAHLIPAAVQALESSLFAPLSGVVGAVNTYQLHQISGQVSHAIDQISLVDQTTKQILSVANNAMLLSGLGIAISAVGFAVLNNKLKNLEGTLGEIKQEIADIRKLLERNERAELAAALRDLLSTVNVPDIADEHRKQLLANARNRLTPLSLKYRELWEEAKHTEERFAYEEYFCLTALSHLRCSADLGMREVASHDAQDFYTTWQKIAKRHAKDLLGKDPERFLFVDFSFHVPISELVGWFDFAYDEDKGYGWIDELRSKTKSYYGAENGISFKWNATEDGRQKHKIQTDKVIPALQKLVARNAVLSGFVSQYQLLEQYGQSPFEFEREMTKLPTDSSVDGYFILQPKLPKL